MKPASANLTAHLALEVTTLATCWKLTRTDSTVMGFTDHDTDIVYDSVTYTAATGFTPTAVENNSNLAVDNLEIEGVLDSSAIAEEDINAGLYDYAQKEIFLVNYNDLSQGDLNLRTGWLGEVRYSKDQFVAEVRGLVQNLAQNIGDLYSPSCRALLGDSKCKINIASYTVTGSITSVADNQIFTDSSRTEDTGYFNFGKITFAGGGNNGLSMEVKEYTDDGKIILVFPMPYEVQAADTYSIHAGCDKNLDTCRDKFSNVVNYRGEPHVPGLDKMLETAGTRRR